MKGRSVKRMVMAVALAVATTISGVANQAQAFSFNEGDLVLAIYGNNTEALYNLGSASTLLASGASTSFNLSAGLTAAGVGTNPVRYTLFGHDLAGPSVFAGTTFASNQINAGQLGLTGQLESSISLQALGGFSGDTVAKADLQSFSTNFNQNGAGNFGGSWPVAMQGTPGDILNIMQGNTDTNVFTQVGRILLGQDGQFIIGNPGPSAVPLPAGVVLFGTGVIGLIGVARRSFSKMAA